MQKSFTEQEKISPVEKDREKNFFTLEDEMFEKEFGFLLQPIKVTPYCGKDFEKAKVLQEVYNNMENYMKNWIRLHDKRLLEEIERKLPKPMVDWRDSTFNQCLEEVKEIIKNANINLS